MNLQKYNTVVANETQAVIDVRSQDILILKSRDSYASIKVLEKTTDEKVFEYAIQHLGVRANTYVWRHILKLAPEKLLLSAIKKYQRESNGCKSIFAVLFNPKISDSDFDYVLRLATDASSLDCIFGRLPEKTSVKVAIKLSAVIRNSDISKIQRFPGLVAIRIFAIQEMLRRDSMDTAWGSYISYFAHDDINNWSKKCRPSKEDFLMVIVTFFCCAQEMNIKCGVPNIEVLVLR